MSEHRSPKRRARRPDSQLRLLPGGEGSSARPTWTLDERTRRMGRHGVAEAREILRRARPPQPVGRRYSKAS